MSIKVLLGLENTTLSDSEIMSKIKDAEDHHNELLEFNTRDGKKITLHLRHQEFAPYIDPWDGPAKAH
ncbi:MAG TPA: hypothetical protein VJB66_03005 [Candidatus Nanoarchaeia archaeon]|nr:hypothetical protein [Candidatus Nanoarchaeia archaeon]